MGLEDMNIEPNEATNEDKITNSNNAKEAYMATAYLLGADQSRYGRLIKSLENDYLQGKNNYPKNMTEAYNLLINWKQDPRNLVKVMGAVKDEVSFSNNGQHDQSNAGNKDEDNQGTNNGMTMTQNSTHSHCKKDDRKNNQELQCYNCGGIRHLSPQCPSAKQSNVKSKGKEDKNQQGDNLFMGGSSSIQDYLEDLSDANNAQTFSFFQMNESNQAKYQIKTGSTMNYKNAQLKKGHRITREQ